MFGQHVGVILGYWKRKWKRLIIIGYVGVILGFILGLHVKLFSGFGLFGFLSWLLGFSISTVVVQVSHPLIAQNKAFDGEAVGSIEVLKERHRARRVALQEKRRHDRSDTQNSQL